MSLLKLLCILFIFSFPYQAYAGGSDDEGEHRNSDNLNSGTSFGVPPLVQNEAPAAATDEKAKQERRRQQNREAQKRYREKQEAAASLLFAAPDADKNHAAEAAQTSDQSESNGERAQPAKRTATEADDDGTQFENEEKKNSTDPELNGNTVEQRRERKRQYQKQYQKQYRQQPGAQERRRQYQKQYQLPPEAQERHRQYQRQYQQRPEVRERRKQYRQQPEVQERLRQHQRQYSQRPEAKERHRQTQRKYSQRPEVRERLRQYSLEKYRQKIIALNQNRTELDAVLERVDVYDDQNGAAQNAFVKAFQEAQMPIQAENFPNPATPQTREAAETLLQLCNSIQQEQQEHWDANPDAPKTPRYVGLEEILQDPAHQDSDSDSGWESE